MQRGVEARRRLPGQQRGAGGVPFCPELRPGVVDVGSGHLLLLLLLRR